MRGTLRREHLATTKATDEIVDFVDRLIGFIWSKSAINQHQTNWKTADRAGDVVSQSVPHLVVRRLAVELTPVQQPRGRTSAPAARNVEQRPCLHVDGDDDIDNSIRRFAFGIHTLVLGDVLPPWRVCIPSKPE